MFDEVQAWLPKAEVLLAKNVDNLVSINKKVDPVTKKTVTKVKLEVAAIASMEACVAATATQKANRKLRNLGPEPFHHNATTFPHTHDKANDVLQIIPNLSRLIPLIEPGSKVFIETQNNASVARYLLENDFVVGNAGGDGKFTSVLAPPNLVTNADTVVYDMPTIAHDGNFHVLNILYTDQAKAAHCLMVRVDFRKMKVGVNKGWAENVAKVAGEAGFTKFGYVKGGRHHTPICHLIFFKNHKLQISDQGAKVIRYACSEAHTIASVCERHVQFAYLLGIRPDSTPLLKRLARLYPKMVIPDPAKESFIIVGKKATPATVEMLIDVTAERAADDDDPFADLNNSDDEESENESDSDEEKDEEDTPEGVLDVGGI